MVAKSWGWPQNDRIARRARMREEKSRHSREWKRDGCAEDLFSDTGFFVFLV